MMSVMQKAFWIALLAIVVTLGQRYLSYWKAKEQMYKVRDSLESLEKSIPRRENTARIAVGLGGCMDVFIRAVPFLEKMNVTPSSNNEPPKSLDSLNDLEMSFSYFFKDGAAAERYLNNLTHFKDIVTSLRDDGRWVLGGNAPVMGNRFAKEGCKVLLGSISSAKMKKDFHKNMISVEDADHGTEMGDVHVIMEYKTGDKWGSQESPRANRYIFHGDQYNPYLAGLETFGEKLKKFKPELLVIGGLQMMDNFPYKVGERLSRLKKLQEILLSVPKETLIHFEMASFIDASLLKEILSTVIPYADSIGMNEQELPNLVSMLTSGNITLSASAYPRTAVMLDEVRRVFSTLEKRRAAGHRRLSRIHLHTLGYQVLAVRVGADGQSLWRSTRAAAAKASLTANRHTCGLQDIDIRRSKMLVDDSFAISAATRNSPRVHFDAAEPVSCWPEGEVEMCVAPVLVCTHVNQTAGGGDNISAATLAVQI